MNINYVSANIPDPNNPRVMELVLDAVGGNQDALNAFLDAADRHEYFPVEDQTHPGRYRLNLNLEEGQNIHIRIMELVEEAKENPAPGGAPLLINNYGTPVTQALNINVPNKVN